jgi:hypothetical protein
MARPPKLKSEEMLSIVNSFFENNGNPGMLKYSHLETYAVSLGVEVKAYDFRRNQAVRQRMEELRQSVEIGEAGIITYKNLDVDAILNRNRTREMLRNSLLELDESWRRIYDKAADLSKNNKILMGDNFAKNQIIETLTIAKHALEAENKSIKAESSTVILENRYLRKALNQYLYPAVANEILKNENVLESVDTEVMSETIDSLVDSVVPASFSSSIAADRDMISREEALIIRMRNKIREE